MLHTLQLGQVQATLRSRDLGVSALPTVDDSVVGSDFTFAVATELSPPPCTWKIAFQIKIPETLVKPEQRAICLDPACPAGEPAWCQVARRDRRLQARER